MSRLRIGFVLALFGAVVACDEPPEEPVAEPEPELEMAVIEAMSERPKPPQGGEAKPRPVGFFTWPGQHEGMTFDLMWLGGDEPLSLREEPDDEASVVATATWFDGEQLAWKDTLVHVQKPRPYTVEEPLELIGTSYDVEFAELEAEERHFELDEGDSVLLYQYGGEGACYVGVEDEIVLAQCPGQGMKAEDDTGLDDGPAWRSLAEQWWVEVAADGDRGWFQVHQAPVEVHTRYIEGYDEFDEGGGPPIDGYNQ